MNISLNVEFKNDNSGKLWVKITGISNLTSNLPAYFSYTILDDSEARSLFCVLMPYSDAAEQKFTVSYDGESLKCWKEGFLTRCLTGHTARVILLDLVGEEGYYFIFGESPKKSGLNDPDICMQVLFKYSDGTFEANVEGIHKKNGCVFNHIIANEKDAIKAFDMVLPDMKICSLYLQISYENEDDTPKLVVFDRTGRAITLLNETAKEALFRLIGGYWYHMFINEEPDLSWKRDGVQEVLDNVGIVEGYDPVSRPSHYCDGKKYEPRKVISDWGLDFNLGSAVKYIARYKGKGKPVEDLQKAIQYITYELENYGVVTDIVYDYPDQNAE